MKMEISNQEERFVLEIYHMGCKKLVQTRLLELFVFIPWEKIVKWKAFIYGSLAFKDFDAFSISFFVT